MSEITAILTRTNPLGTTLLLIGDDLLSDGELVASAEVGKDVFEKLLTFAENNQEVRVVISYSDDSHLKLYDYANTVVEDEDGYKGVILEKTGICLYNGTEPTIGDDIAPFVNAGGGGGGSDLPEVDSTDNGKVLTVVSGEWDKATPAKELPAVSGSDNDKVLTVVNGAWTKKTPATPASRMNVRRICVEDYGNEYVLRKAWPEGGNYTNPNFDDVDAIYIDNGDDSISILGTFGYRYYYHSGQESRNSNDTKFFNPNSTYGIVLDANSAVENITIENVTFTWNGDDGYFSCPHN